MSRVHVTNGDCAAATLREFIRDPIVITADVLHDGPASLVDGDAWHRMRARYHAGDTPGDFERIRQGFHERDAAITDGTRDDEVVLWFEHDLFDQLLLVRTLDLLARRAADVRPSVSLICIDRFPGIPRFIGLGQLTAAQLESLVDTRRPVTAPQFEEASRIWHAFRASDPTVLTARIGSVGALPFLQSALRRFLAEYPSTANGLSRTADAALKCLGDAPLDAFALFGATQEREPAPFMGDFGFFDVVRKLARARTPLVVVDGGPASDEVDLRGRTIALTDDGQAVLAGRRDAVELNGIDEWRGGVHLLGANQSPWRWDEARESLVSFS